MKKINKILNLTLFLIIGIIIFSYLGLSEKNQHSILTIEGKKIDTSKLDSKLIEELNKRTNKFSISSNDELKIVVKYNTEIKDKVDKLGLENQEQEIKYISKKAISAKIKKLTEIEKFISDSNVEKIYWDYPVKITLDSSIPQINASTVWNISVGGIKINGSGQTVCVIDTGIQYSHPALGGCNPVSYTFNGSIENLSTPVESAHNYSNNFDYTWKINKSGYSNIAIHFTNISLEKQGTYDTTDRIFIYDGNNDTLAIYKSNITDIWSPSAVGDTIYVRLVTDPSVGDYGFYIDQIINGTTNTTMNWSSCSKVIGRWDTYNNDNNPIDDHYHGTHVAGTVASINDTYKGVAPEAKLIAIKALSSSGNGYSSDVAAGIEWCTNNAELYNISVISMSLGCDGGSCTHYQTYCNDDLTTEYINAAYAKGIIVAIAAGNDGWTDGISNPACVGNATPVGGVDGSDGIVYNRGNLLKLLTPGTSIYSTYPTSTWNTLSGTSMATPHLSGAVALFRQYWKLAYNQTPTKSQIENKLFITGKTVSDAGGSGLNFSRVNLLLALQPYINFSSNSISNGTISSNNYAFINITSDVNLSSANLEWNYNNGTITNYSMNYFNPLNYYYNITNLTSGTYTYKVYGKDVTNLTGLSQIRTYTINFQINLLSPANNNYTNNSTPQFIFNLSYNQFLNATCTLFVNNISLGINNSVSNNTNTMITANSSLNEGIKTWYINCTDNSAGNSSSEIRNLYVDLNSPTINLVSPNNNSWRKNSTLNASFNFTDTISANSSCVLFTNGNSSANNNSVLNNTLTNLLSNISLNQGINNWSVRCTDSALNTITSNTFNVYFDNTSPVINLINPINNNLTNSNQPNFTFNVTDNYSNTNNCTLWINSTARGLNESILNNTNSLISSNSSLSDGNYNWQINCTDLAGNAVTSSLRNISIDNTSPIVIIHSINGKSSGEKTNNATIQINITVNDLNLNYYNISVYNSSSVIINSTQSSGNINATTINFTLTSQDTYIINLTAKDNATNSAIATFNLIYDTTLPNISTISASGTSTTGSSGTVTVTATTSETATCWYSTSNFTAVNTSSATQMSGSGTTSSSFTVTYTSSTTLGPYYISCRDMAGNNMNTSNSTGSITTTITSTSSSSSGGGGGGSSDTQTPITTPTTTTESISNTPAKSANTLGVQQENNNQDQNLNSAANNGDNNKSNNQSKSNLIGRAFGNLTLGELNTKEKILLGMSMMVIILGCVYFVFVRK